MTADPRAALSDLVAALERHLETAAGSRDDDDPHVAQAYDRIAETFTVYADALVEAYDEEIPLDVYDDSDDDDVEDDSDAVDEDDDDEVDDDDVDDGEARSYLGLGDDEFDVEPRPRG
ncbi:MAG: hypothetical protein Q4P07_00440 [Ornithinimicrobium sp.]|uniref:hypothetical protein n=1 Tax=Ornithinimicrobium sp. TaxID=1977084 RepID=UPI0026DEB5E9|nr:hypothetical protein [Ornithinimicrobium sp.]MDO5738597.1 hypothetical protein [Ornithinimicrobium sp.]